MEESIQSLNEILFFKRFENELEYMKSIQNMDEEKLNRLEQLNQIINNLVEKQNMDNKNIHNEVEKYIYKKQWNRLQPYHRVVKITEYINETYKGKKFSKKLMSDLIKLINSNKLTSNKSVEYDIQNEKVLSIPALKFNKDNTDYTIKC